MGDLSLSPVGELDDGCSRASSPLDVLAFSGGVCFINFSSALDI